MLIIDEHSRGYIYSAVDDSLLEIENLPPGVQGCLWDADDTHIFTIWDNHNQLFIFAIQDQHIGQFTNQINLAKPSDSTFSTNYFLSVFLI